MTVPIVAVGMPLARHHGAPKGTPAFGSTEAKGSVVSMADLDTLEVEADVAACFGPARRR